MLFKNGDVKYDISFNMTYLSEILKIGIG